MAMDLREQLQASLGTAYAIERELGGGGMSRVFVADERRFGRKVVIKVLPPDVAGVVSADRFEREIQLAARLQHPHIVPLLTAGDAGGLLYYTMPFIQGETLRDRVAREGRLPLGDALRIAGEVADALACAHAGGVVHRDIKPENILLSSGHAMVVDFGIAKALAVSKRSEGTQDPTLTQLGTALGTPAYMSPEQAAGESDLDGRTDIYSLGCVLYEMLAGRQPFTGPNAAIVMAKRFTEVPAPLRTTDAAIPGEVDQVVARAMARDPADRFATADDLRRDLATTSATPSGPRAALDEKPSVAVLPFTNLSANADDEYFSDGMTDEVINALAHLPTIRVAGRTSAFVFKGQRVDLRTIAQQLRVQTILEGTVRRAGSRVRISVQLVDAADGLHLWSERYDRELADTLALQDEIAQTIAQALEHRLGAAKAVTPSRPILLPADRVARASVDPAAYDVFLRGRFLFEQHAGLEAIACFERVVAMDPSFAPGHAWLAHGNILSANINLHPALTGYPRARAAADRALELDPKLPEALLGRAAVAIWFDWDLPRGEQLFREVVALAPGWPIAHEFLGWTAVMGGRFDDMKRALEHAMALDPLSDFMLYNYALALWLAGESTQALDVMRPALARSSGRGGLPLLYGTALMATGQLQEARTTLERALELTPVGSQFQGTLVEVRAAMGDVDLARQRLAELEAQVERGKESAAEVAYGHHVLGDDESAFLWLERAFQARALWMPYLHIEPRFQRLRGTPQFEAIIERVGVAR
jgi:serine/threonine protein kinase/tetratricopeptide (TPR) repeat protein